MTVGTVDKKALTLLTRGKQARGTERAVVLRAAEKLFRKYGFEAVGMRDIATASATNPVQLYRMGLTKPEILGDLILKLNARQIREMRKLDIISLGRTPLERIKAYLLELYRLDLRDKELRKLGAAYGWLWSRERERDVVAQIGELVAPVDAEIRRAGLDRAQSRCLAIWSLYYVGYRTAVMADGSAEDCLASIAGPLALIVPETEPT